MRLADRIAVMRKGLIVQTGDAEDLYRHPEDLFIARFFSEINELRARLVNGRVDHPLVDWPIDDLPESDDIIVCIRQQGVKLGPKGHGRAARVVDVRFMGDSATVEVAAEGLEQTIHASVRDGDTPEQGMEVGLTIDPSSVLIFPDPNVKDV